MDNKDNTEVIKEFSFYDLLNDNEKGFNEEIEQEFVFLRGLKRLARIAGLYKIHTFVHQTPAGNNAWSTVITVRTYYNKNDSLPNSIFGEYDGTASSDAKNCTNAYGYHRSSVAESRALARSIRHALGIDIVSEEEISNITENEKIITDDGCPITDQQIQAISIICKRNKLDVSSAIKKYIERNDVSIIEQLSFNEAKYLLKNINNENNNDKENK